MKPYFSWKTLCLLLCLALLAGCSDDDEQPDPQLPPLVWPDDVATAIPDEGFREYCLERYDRDKDGRLSKDEVLAVKKMIHFPDASGRFLSLEGIEYFSNLENFAWEYSGPKEIDLRYNSRLQKISCLYNSNLIRFRGPVGYTPLEIELYSLFNLEELDLSGCGNVQELRLFVDSFSEVKLSSVNLPDPSHLQYLAFAATNAGCYDALLADGANLKKLYYNFYPSEVLDLSHCPKLADLIIHVRAGSELKKIRMHKNAPIAIYGGGIDIRDEKGNDCSSSVEIEYVE